MIRCEIRTGSSGDKHVVLVSASNNEVLMTSETYQGHNDGAQRLVDLLIAEGLRLEVARHRDPVEMFRGPGQHRGEPDGKQ